jgi:hypothetical protein
LDLKNQGKKSAKTRKLGSLKKDVHRVGKKAENQRKSREKSKVVENQVFWLDFCAKKKDCAYTLGSGSISQRQGSADPDPDPHQNVMDPQHWFWRY